MILFVNINSIPVESVLDGTKVVDCKINVSFCNHIGLLLIEGLTDSHGTPACQLVNQPSNLLIDYKQVDEAGFAAIISEWEQRILPRLFNETFSKNQRFDILIPESYTEWLSQHINDVYSEAGKKLKRESNVVHLSAAKLQKDVVEEIWDILEHNILYSEKNTKWFTLSDGRISEDSEFIKDVLEIFPDIRFMSLETYMDLMETERKDKIEACIEENVNIEEAETSSEENVNIEGTEASKEENVNIEEAEANSEKNVNIEGTEANSEENETSAMVAVANREENMKITVKEVRRKSCNILTFNANGVFFDMIPINGGTFMMGATPEQLYDAWDCEKPKHNVTLSDYYLGEFEVTQALWQAVMGYNPSPIQGDNLPVVKVSWNDCQSFISKLNEICSKQLEGKRFALPTESQWEYAARGGNKSRGYKYSGSNSLNFVAWHRDNSGNTLHAVGMKSSNELGLYDMTGNVGEWCSDWYGAYDFDSLTDPTGPSSGFFRVHRGGSWSGSMKFCRVSHRLSGAPNITDSNLGFRLALCL